MNLQKFLSGLSKEQKLRFARDCKCSVGHLFNVICDNRKCSAQLAIRIEKCTYGRVSKEEVAPHVEW